MEHTNTHMWLEAFFTFEKDTLSNDATIISFPFKYIYHWAALFVKEIQILLPLPNQMLNIKSHAVYSLRIPSTSFYN